MNFSFEKKGSVFTLQELSIKNYEYDAIYFNSLTKDNEEIYSRGTVYLRRTKDVFYLTFNDDCTKAITNSLNAKYSKNLNIQITEEEHELAYSKRRELAELMKLEEKAQKISYDLKHFYKDSKEIVTLYDDGTIRICDSKESIILEEYEKVLNECRKINKLRREEKVIYQGTEIKNCFKEFLDKFKLYDWGDYSITNKLEIPFNELEQYIENIKNVHSLYNLELKRIKEEKEREHKEKINNLIALAKKEGEPQLVNRWIEPCNDRSEECNFDEVLEFVDSNGKFTIKRYHTY